jgi:hypothetical protein
MHGIDANSAIAQASWTFFPSGTSKMTTPHLNHIGVVQGLMRINHRLDHAGHASVGTQNLRSTTERPLPCVRKM